MTMFPFSDWVVRFPLYIRNEGKQIESGMEKISTREWVEVEEKNVRDISRKTRKLSGIERRRKNRVKWTKSKLQMRLEGKRENSTEGTSLSKCCNTLLNKSRPWLGHTLGDELKSSKWKESREEKALKSWTKVWIHPKHPKVTLKFE